MRPVRKYSSVSASAKPAPAATLPPSMAHGVQRPHDKLFRTVFADHAEAAALLRAHLPEDFTFRPQ